MSVNLMCVVARSFSHGASRHYNKARRTLTALGTPTPTHSSSATRRIHLGQLVATESAAKIPHNRAQQMTNEDWAKKLTEEQYFITREQGTEAPFTGKYYKNTQDGIYHCVCCNAELFSSKTKYDSGSGWPSFYESLKEAEAEGVKTGVLRRSDMSQGMVRTECICQNCNAHLGHVFNDGPKPTGERYCINSAALRFQPKKM